MSLFHFHLSPFPPETPDTHPDYRASDRLRKKKSNFRGFSDTNSLKFSVLTSPIGKKWLISWEFSVQILLEINRFCADLLSMFNVF